LDLYLYMDALSADLHFFQQAIGLHEQRAQVLSTNIANADTPNYKARDFSFETALKNAVGKSGSLRLPDTSLDLTSKRHIAATAQNFNILQMKYRVPFQASVDGNTVEMDVERTAFADNTVRQQAAITMINGRIRAMTTALTPN